MTIAMLAKVQLKINEINKDRDSAIEGEFDDSQIKEAAWVREMMAKL